MLMIGDNIILWRHKYFWQMKFFVAQVLKFIPEKSVG